MPFQDIKTFFRESTVYSLRFLADKKITLLERFLWLIINICMIILTCFIVYNLHYQLFNNPTITSLDRRDYPVENINFPGVAICNINIISKKRADNIAEKIANITKKSKREVLRYIKMLGGFLNYNIDQHSEFLKAQETLEQYYNESFRIYTPFLMLYELQLPCEEFIKECHWMNKEYDCRDLFELRITYTGFCCTFNYVREKHHLLANGKHLNLEPYKVTEVGMHNGLKVIVNNDLEDYMYSTAPPAGVKIITFNPEDFPDMTSGGLAEAYTSSGAEALLSVHPYSIYSTPEIRDYPLATRKCSFDDEFVTIYGKYSYSNCIVQCRVFSMLSLCGCLPFQTPAPKIYPVCLLQDIVCLNKYKVKWNTLYPFESANVEELSHEKEESLLCEKCYYACADTIYQIETNFTPLNNTNDTIIRIYFQSNYVYLYKQDVKYYWFELLSFVGGVLGIMMGNSFITIAEILKFILERIVNAIVNQFK